MPITNLRLRNTLVSDLTPLAGMPLSELDCTAIPAVDFSPLAKCPQLLQLWLSHTAANELATFQQCKLRDLRIDNTGIRDLSSLAGMPLLLVHFCETDVTDLTPLLQCPTLEAVGLSHKARNVAALRALPNLRRISYRADAYGEPAQTAAKFWESWDASTEGKE